MSKLLSKLFLSFVALLFCTQQASGCAVLILDERPLGGWNSLVETRNDSEAVGFVDGPNLYAYVRQNPWTAWDPDGLDAVTAYGCQPRVLMQTFDTMLGKVDGLINLGISIATAGDPDSMRQIGSPIYHNIRKYEDGEILYRQAIENTQGLFTTAAVATLSRPGQPKENVKAPSAELKPEAAAKDTTARQAYMGNTPGKGSPTGKEVIQRMLGEGKIRMVNGGAEVLGSDGKWINVNKTDMSHIKDAVKAWNEGLKETGAKSPEVKAFMKDPNNYELDSSSINRKRGAELKEKYEPPVPYKTKEEKK